MSTEEKILELVKEADPENPIEFVNSIVRPYAREKLDNLILGCHDCPTCSKEHVKSLTYGHDQASVLIINEGIYDSQIGNNTETVYPLQGAPEMMYMDAIIDDYHINRNQLFWINAINCRPMVGINGKRINRPPNSHEAECCRGYVEIAIDIIHPVLIILLGNIPLNMFSHGESIMKAHGKWIDIRGVKAMPVYSPSFLRNMRDDKSSLSDLVDEYEADFCEDLKTAFLYVQNNFDGNVVLEPLA